MDVNRLIATAEALGPSRPLHELPDDLATYEDAERPEVRGAWRIETIQSADWALARMAELQVEAEGIDEQAKAAKERIDQRASALKDRIARGLGYFRFKLLEYAERNRDAILGGGRKKSRAFLHGQIGWRRRGGRLTVKDPEALNAWLLAQPPEAGLYRMEVKPEMAELQRRLKEAGEVPPGCDVEPEVDEPYVKAEAPGTALAKE